ADVARNSAGTMLWSQELTLGRTPVGNRLLDLRAVLRSLRGRPDLEKRVALWGDSFGPANSAKDDLAVPWDAPKTPHPAEPLGGLLALLGGLFDDGVAGVYVHGGLVNYLSMPDGPFCYVAPDTVVPGALR